MEQLLHYVWKHKIFPLCELQTSSGLPVEVIDAGLQNSNAGPDFFNAKIKINDTVWVGNVEIHSVSSDWNKHGHHTNKVYDSVILHVSGNIDCDVYRSNGDPVPQLQLECPDSIRVRYYELKQTDIKPRCFGIIPDLSRLAVHSWLTALQTERFMQKTMAIRERLELLNNNWEDVFFITLSRNFGFGINGDAFEAWAKSIPYRAVDKHRDNLTQVEAFFFGQGGFLKRDHTDIYYKELKQEFQYLKYKFNLREFDSPQFKYLRLRPGNFPNVRIAQLAYLYHKERGLFSRVMEAASVKEVKEIFTLSTSEYWKEHFNFDKPSPKSEKKLGNGALDLLIINTVVPFLYARGLHKDDESLCIRAAAFLEELKAESNYATRLWDGMGIPVHTAADSQALLQLQKEYCDKKKCLCCRFGYEYLRCKI